MTCATFTTGLISYLLISFLVAKFSELLIHMSCSIECVVAEIFLCSDIFSIKRIAKQKIRVEKIELEVIMSDVAIEYLGQCLSQQGVRVSFWHPGA